MQHARDPLESDLRDLGTSLREHTAPTALALRDEVKARLFGPASQLVIADRYRLEKLIGRGGTARVYRALDTRNDQIVALKLLSRTDQTLRFRKEFHTLARIRHPNIVHVLDVGSDPAGAYYTMELLEDGDLREAASGDPSRLIGILHDIASALAFLHTRSLVHRDLSPRNVRLAPDGTAKLIDFGLLAASGMTGEAVGTPPFASPESVRGLPVDHRSDLFALGAFAYWLLTGKHAFDARTFGELERTWQTLPVAPSRSAPRVPPKLVEIVLSLLSLDPMARPSSAAEVLQQLRPDGPAGVREKQVQAGYLSSATCVGRSAELARVEEAIEGLDRGLGSAIVFEGDSGFGKSHLLRESGLRARVSGAIVAFSDAPHAAAPFGVVRQLLAATTRAHPELDPAPLAAIDAFEKRRAPPVAWSPVEDGMDRLTLQSHLVAWLSQAARAVRLVLVIDNAQRADQASLATLTALIAQGTPLVVLSALRLDEKPHEAHALLRLRDACTCMRLAEFKRRDVEDLVTCTFGAVSRSKSLASEVFEHTAGAPLACMEAIRHGVEQGVIRYAGGTWEVTGRIDRSALPKRVSDTFERDVAGLPRAARHLAERVAVLGEAFTIARARRLAPEIAETALFETLDLLASHSLLVRERDTYRFRHDAVRESFLRSMPDDARRSHHLAAAELLASEGVHPLQAGFHFKKAERPIEAAPLLERAGRELYHAEALRACVAPLEAALEIQLSLGDPSQKTLELRSLLMLASLMTDRAAAERHVESSLQEAWLLSGLSWAERWEPWVGSKVGLLLGVIRAAWAWFFSGGRRPHPLMGIEAAVVIATCATHMFCHLGQLDRLKQLMARMTLFERSGLPALRIAYHLSHASLLIPEGRYREAQQACDVADALLRKEPRGLKGFALTAAKTTVHNVRAWIYCSAHDPRCANELAAVEASHLPAFAYSTAMVRAQYHRFRGEEGRALVAERRAEDVLVALGCAWPFEVSMLRQSAIAVATTGDVVGLRRNLEKLEGLVRDGFRIDEAVLLARGEYHRLCGRLDEAERDLGLLCDRLDGPSELVQHAQLALSLVLEGQGKHDAAREHARTCIALSAPPAQGFRHFKWRAECVLALVDAKEGHATRALDTMARIARELDDITSPVLLGEVAEARARVHIALGNRDDAALAADEVVRVFGLADNPALAQRAERLRTHVRGLHDDSRTRGEIGQR